MKLVYFQTARMPTEKAHGLQIVKMAEAFAQKGIDVELVLPKRFNKIKQDIFEYYRVKKIFKVKKLPCLDFLSVLNKGPVVSIAEPSKLKVLSNFFDHFLFFLMQLSFALFLVPYILLKKAISIQKNGEELVSNGVNIFYTRDKFFLFLAYCKKNLCFECHTLPKNFWLYKPWLKKTKTIIVITNKLKEEIVKRGIAENKIIVAPDGVDLNQFKVQTEKLKVKEKLHLPSNKQIALYTGHLYKWKGVYTMLKAAKYLADVLFVFVGGTKKDIEEFKQKTKMLALNNILIVGHKPPPEIPLWLASADVLVLPNSGNTDISRFWTSPLKMFEYMAAGNPIVASNLPSLREVLNENNAVFFEPDKANDLANKIKYILQKRDFSDKISKRALQDVRNFTWQKRAQKIIRA